MFTLCEFGPVWILELPNLEVKPAVFLPYFPAYEMIVNFDSNLDKRHLATQENRQVVTAYFKSNTSKGKDTMRPFFFVEDTAGDMKDDDHMTTMMMMRMMRIEVIMMILMTFTTTMTLNQR